MNGKRVDDERLRRLWATRLTDKEIAQRLGHHRGVLRRRAQQLGLPNRRNIWAKDECAAGRQAAAVLDSPS